MPHRYEQLKTPKGHDAMSIANSKRRYHKVIMTMLVGAAIGLGSGVIGAAPASAAPNTIGPNPNPFSTLGCNCGETAPAGSPTLRDEIARGLRLGHSASLPGLSAPTQR
jgi:hypothetical protein